MKRNISLLMSVVLLIWLPKASLAEDILIGMTAAFSGASGHIGQQMRAGIDLGLAEVNATGGIHGRKIRLVVRDDGYKPLQAAYNMRSLIEEDNVLAVVGNPGTPTAALTVPIANDAKVLLLGAYTGADLLRHATAGCCVYNYRASYKQEVAMMVDHIVKSGVEPGEIAFFTQNDAFGDAGYQAGIEALSNIGFVQAIQLPHVRYRRNTINVEQAVASILMLKKPPKAMIMVGTYAASAAFITLLKHELPQVAFYNISFTGSAELLNHLGQQADGVFITEVVPDINADISIAKQYREAIKQYGKSRSPNVISFEGYIVARLLIEGLVSIKGDINRGSVLSSMNDLDCSLLVSKGSSKCFSSDNRQISQTVWLNQVINGEFHQMDVRTRDESGQ